MKNTYFS